MTNKCMQLSEVITRDRGKHVVLNMIIHVVIQEPSKRWKQYRTRTQSKICYVILQPGVLRLIAQKTQPAAIKNPESGQERQQPETKETGATQDGGMAAKAQPRPISETTIFLLFVRWEQMLFQQPRCLI